MKFYCLFLLGCASAIALPTEKTRFGNGVFSVKPSNEDNALVIEIVHGSVDVVRVRGKLGLSVPSAVGAYTQCSTGNPLDFCVEWGDYARLLITSGNGPSGCGRIEWTSSYAREIEDCFDLEPGVHWYGGGEMFTQIWPIETRPRKESVYVTADSMADNEGQFGGVLENYWLLSNGAAVVIDPDTPLHFSLNSTRSDRVCFIARDQTPFTKRSPLKFNYEWCTASDVKEAHHAAMTYFDKPDAIPDETMLVRPLWSTWAEYKTEVNQSIVLDYARRVVSEGFGASSHIEIDDHWETCYGQEEFNPEKFPDPKAMIDEIKAMDMRVTAWVHPFVNYGCPLFNEGMERGYFVKDAKGKTGITSWWQGGNSGIIDATNPDAVAWWTGRLRKLQQDTGLDSFKFDAGETNWLPASTALTGDTDSWPQVYSTKYVEACAAFGGLVETRTAHLNHRVPIFIRMLDKDSRWGYNNGLQSLIPTLLQFGIVGYPFVLPDMIGGNAYGEMPEKELYVRWMQANIFMPAVQFSIVPWKYDQETVDICKDVLAQRENHRDRILEAARQAVADGSPINRPIWWVDPLDVNTFTIDNAYMLGDTILVAPVVEQGAVSRDIYLPRGTWTSGTNSSETYTGPRWLRSYPTPLNVVPFFIKDA